MVNSGYEVNVLGRSWSSCWAGRFALEEQGWFDDLELFGWGMWSGENGWRRMLGGPVIACPVFWEILELMEKSLIWTDVFMENPHSPGDDVHTYPMPWRTSLSRCGAHQPNAAGIHDLDHRRVCGANRQCR